MGGHLTWRSAFWFCDRWAAVSPMSGGYDFVKSQDVWNLVNVPGYSTFGTEEPYDINPFNKTIAAWMQSHRYSWTCVEKDGGHEIFVDEVVRIGEFFAAQHRDLYRKVVDARVGALRFETAETNAKWGKEHTWTKGRPLDLSTVHWLRFCDPAEDVLEVVDESRGRGRRPLRVPVDDLTDLGLGLSEEFDGLQRPRRCSSRSRACAQETVAASPRSTASTRRRSSAASSSSLRWPCGSGASTLSSSRSASLVRSWRSRARASFVICRASAISGWYAIGAWRANVDRGVPHDLDFGHPSVTGGDGWSTNRDRRGWVAASRGRLDRMEFRVEIEREEDGRWIAEVPALPGVMVYGQSREEAMAHAEVLALRVLADRLEHGETVPELSGLFSAA